LYYENPKKLLETALRYTGRYNVSRNKLIAYMLKKTSNMSVILQVADEINIDESKIIRNLVYSYRLKLKNFFEIS